MLSAFVISYLVRSFYPFLTFGPGKGFILAFALANIWIEVYINFYRVINKTIADLDKQSAK